MLRLRVTHENGRTEILRFYTTYFVQGCGCEDLHALNYTAGGHERNHFRTYCGIDCNSVDGGCSHVGCAIRYLEERAEGKKGTGDSKADAIVTLAAIFTVVPLLVTAVDKLANPCGNGSKEMLLKRADWLGEFATKGTYNGKRAQMI